MSEDVFALIQFQNGTYYADERAVRFLQGIKKKIAVVVCAGKFRTGKSVLLNVLCETADCFNVGDTTTACTKGIWLRKTPLFETDDRVVLVMDTEGIDSLGDASSSEHDVRIFTLALLLASSFLYNSVGAIDESQVSTLSLMTKVSQFVRLQASGSNDAASGPESLADAMPAFYWLLRDFSLKMASRDGEECSAERYMEEALGVQPHSSEERNRVREAIRGAFRRRKAVPLCRPTQSENTARLGPHNVSRKFRIAVEGLRSKLLDEIEPLKVEGKPISGGAYASLVTGYVKALNIPGAVPVIRDVWSLAAEVQARDTKDEILQTAREAVANLGSVRMSVEALEAELLRVRADAESRFAAAALEASPSLQASLGNELALLVKHALKACTDRIDELVNGAMHALEEHACKATTLHDMLVSIETSSQQVFALTGESKAADVWRRQCYDKLLRTWLPAYEARSVEATAQLQQASEDAASECAAAIARAQTAEQRVSSLDRMNMETQGALTMLQAKVATLETTLEASDAQLRDERARVEQLEVKLILAAAPTSKDAGTEDEEDGAAQSEGPTPPAESDEAFQMASSSAELEMQLDESRASLAEITAVCNTLRDENSALRSDVDRVNKEWTERVSELQVRHAESCERMRVTTAERMAKGAEEVRLATQREEELRRKLGEVERREVRLQSALTTVESSYVRELRVDKEAAMASRALAEDLQIRMLSMHATTLEDLRKRDATSRERLQQMLSEKVDLEVMRASAQGALEKARGETNDLKRKLAAREDYDRDVKRLRDEAQEERARREAIEKELLRQRTKMEEAIAQREEANKKVHASVREAAGVERELALIKAERASPR